MTKIKSFLQNLKSNKGQSMIELIIAVTMFAIFGTGVAVLVFDALSGTKSGEESTVALYLAQEGIDATRSIRDTAWNNLVNGNHGIQDTSSYWQFNGTSDIDGNYTRQIAISDVSRDGGGDIVLSGGSVDPRTKHVLVTVSWTSGVITRNVIQETYLLDWAVMDWNETTDAEYGDGVHSSTEVTGTGINGSVRLLQGSGATLPSEWQAGGGANFTDTNDTDFNQGVHAGTNTLLSGTPAKLNMDSSLQWDLFDFPFGTVDMLFATENFASGKNGKMYQWLGAMWVEVESFTTEDIKSIAEVSSTEAYAVAKNGELLRFNGSTWGVLLSPTVEDIEGISMISSSDGIAVGDAGTILRWNGTVWSSMVSPTTENIRSVSMVSATDGFAVGKNGMMLRWDGLTWSIIASSTSEDLEGVEMLSAIDGFAVGKNGIVINWDGVAWSTMATPTNEDLKGLSMISSTDGFAVGKKGEMLRWDGVSWGTFLGPTNENFEAVYMISSTDGWAVGKKGVVLRWNGSSWLPYTQVSNNDFFAVDSFSPTDINAVGKGGIIVNWDGFTWSEQSSPTNNNLAGVSMVSATGGFIVGENGTALRWDGAVWSIVPSSTGEDLEGISMVSSTDGFAVGRNGAIIRWNGVSWSTLTSPTTEELRSISMISSGDGFAVGLNGKIIRWNGSSWVTFTSPTGQDLYGVDMVSSVDGWAVGRNGAILHWDGVTWSVSASPTGQTLYDISMLSAANGYAVGKNGVVLKWDGLNWANLTSPTGQNLFGAFYSSVNEAWGVGKKGTMVRLGEYFLPSGVFESRVFDSFDPLTTWDIAYWSENNYSLTDLTIATRTGNSLIPDGSWSTWSAELTNFANSSILSPDGRYLQYRVTLTTFEMTISPELENITIVYNDPGTVNHINEVSMVSASDGWAVADNGKILKWNNVAWEDFSSPTANNINGVDMVTSSNGWAVSDGGTIIQYDGTNWVSVTSPTGNNLNDVRMVSASDGWAVGNGGVVAKWDGATWATVPSSTTNDLNAIYMVSSTDGWAVGGGGVIIQWDGVAWATVVSPVTQNLFGLDMVATNDGWASGASGKILKYNGVLWTEFADSGNIVLEDISMINSALGYMVGDSGTILKWENIAWLLDFTTLTENLNTVEMVTSTEGWAMGDNGEIVHYTPLGAGATPLLIIDDTQPEFDTGTYTSTQWNTDHVELILPVTSGTYASEVFDSTDSSGVWSQIAWAETLSAGGFKMEAGSTTTDGNFATVNLTNTYVSPIVIPFYHESSNSEPVSARLRNVGATSFEIALHSPSGGGGSSATHTNDTDFNAGTYSNTELKNTGTPASVFLTETLLWSNGSSTGSENVEDISMITATDGWAASKASNVYHYNGTTWTIQTTPAGDDLKGISAVDTSNVWAVGKGPVITYYNGSTWVNQTNPAADDLEDISMISTSFGVAVGKTGSIVHWNGSAWSSVSSPSSEDLKDVSMISTSDGFAVGKVPATTAIILRWNGTSWSSIASPANDDLESVAMYDSSFGIAVGKSGNIIHWNGSSWASVASPTVQDLSAVDVLSPTYAVAVGKSGVLLHWNGVSWSLDTSSTGQDIKSVSIVAENDVWGGGKGPTFPHYHSEYPTSGTFESSVIDSGDITSQWDLLSWSEDITAAGTDITIDTRTGNTATPDGSWSVFVGTLTNPAGATITSPDAQYLQYRVNFSTTDVLVTPEFLDATVTYSLPGPTILTDTIHYMVVEEGAWTMPDGTLIEAHNDVTTTIGYKHNWNADAKTYTNTYAAAPLVLHAVQTYNDTTWVESWVSRAGSKSNPPNTSGFQIGMNGAEAITSHGSETIGWVAMAIGTGVIDGINFESQITTDTVRGHSNGCYNFNFTNSYSSNPLVIGDQLEMDGGDGAWGISCALSTTSIGLHSEEDQVTDSERAHTTETFGFLAFDSAFDYAAALDLTFQVRSCNDATCSGESFIGPDGTAGTVYTTPGGEVLNVIPNQYFQYQATFSGTGTESPDLAGVTINYSVNLSGGGGSGYPPSGMYLSNIVNSDSTLTTWETLFWEESVPTNTDLTIAIRVGDTPTPDGSWTNFSSEYSNTQGVDINLTGQYLQYRATMTSNDSNFTSQLEDITVTYHQ